jgi:hypothetical protein
MLINCLFLYQRMLCSLSVETTRSIFDEVSLVPAGKARQARPRRSEVRIKDDQLNTSLPVVNAESSTSCASAESDSFHGRLYEKYQHSLRKEPFVFTTDILCIRF